MESIDLWRGQAFLGCLAGSGCVAWLVGKKTNWITALGAFFALASAAVVFQFPASLYGEIQFRMDQSAGQAFAQFISVILCGLLIKAEILYGLFAFIALINSLILLCGGVGLFHVYSLDTAYIAMCLPILIQGLRRIRLILAGLVLLPVMLAILFKGGTTGVAVMEVSLLTYCALTKRVPEALWILGLGVMAFVAIGAFGFFNPGGRFQEWSHFMTWWIDHSNILVGSGTGTFEWLSPVIQNRPKEIYLFMHNDYLQILFEQGILGLTLALGVVFTAIQKSKDPVVISSIAGILTACVTQSPMRFWLSGLMIATTLKAALSTVDTVSELT